MKSRKIRPGAVIYCIIVTFILLLCAITKPVTDWLSQTFVVGIETIIFTLISPLDGADISFVGEAVIACIPYVIAAVVFIAFLQILGYIIHKRLDIRLTGTIHAGKKRGFKIDVDERQLYRVGVFCLAVLMSLYAFRYFDRNMGLTNYIRRLANPTTLYEDYYVDPESVAITAPENQKNLIYIYVESLETTYASDEVGGRQGDINYMPNMTLLAEENINFSNNDRLGGFISTYGSRRTMDALFATTAGVPLTFPVYKNSMGKLENFAAGITTLGDVLHENGYNQEFLCGSDATFAGRRNYFTQHGSYEIFDYFTAIEKGYVPEGEKIYWGYEDYLMFDIARDEATRLASLDQPFNLTMLTVDMHHVGGHICPVCDNKYDEKLCNVIDCMDRLVYDFVNWCREQDFYEDTVIVITGDHPRLDTILVEGIPKEERPVYDCFINVDKSKAKNMKNRTFTHADIFPTVLSALDFKIEGNRLGLGTNMFSKKKTVAEQMGYDVYAEEVQKYSEYYITHFS